MRAIVFALILICAVHPATADQVEVRSVETGGSVPEARFVERLRAADVIILGETHDNSHHHRNQAWVIQRIGAVALVAEMIQSRDEARITEHLADGGDVAEIGPMVDWDKTGWPKWAIYLPVFEALPSGASVFGASLPREEVRRVMTEPASAILPDPVVAPLLETPLPPDLQAEVEQEMVESHCGELPKEMAPMMVSAQRLRDASLAAAVLRARDQVDGPIVVIAGNGHARRDRGMPYYLAQVAPDLNIIVVGQIEDDGSVKVREAAGIYDYVWLTPVHQRPDPCEALRKRKK